MNTKYLSVTRRNFLWINGLSIGSLLVPNFLLAKESYQESTQFKGGHVQGTVKFNGQVPVEDKILIAKDNEHCGEGSVNPDPVVIGKNGAVESVVVFIEKIATGKPWENPMDAPKVMQKNCKFAPYIQITRKGAELEIINEDPLLHNIHTYELIGRARRSMFNIAQPSAGQVDRQLLKTRKSNLVEIDCDAHNWMSAWIFLTETPYVEMTSTSGEFSLKNIPEGKYKLKAWHPILGKGEQELSISANTTTNSQISINL